jgi:hypothetical protein
MSEVCDRLQVRYSRRGDSFSLSLALSRHWQPCKLSVTFMLLRSSSNTPTITSKPSARTDWIIQRTKRSGNFVLEIRSVEGSLTHSQA